MKTSTMACCKTRSSRFLSANASIDGEGHESSLQIATESRTASERSHFADEGAMS